MQLTDAALVYPGPPPITALQATSLSVDAGDYVSITGASGSGKSTLLSVIGLLEPPTVGTVHVDGVDLTDLASNRIGLIRARTFGFVFQRFHLLPAISALDNVELALLYQGHTRPERSEMARRALERVGLGERAGHRPAELSGGEQQRVAIARAIACRQPCLLADEPTGNLDSSTTEGVLELLDQIADEGTTVICVTHSQDVAARARRHLMVRDGVIISDTTDP